MTSTPTVQRTCSNLYKLKGGIAIFSRIAYTRYLAIKWLAAFGLLALGSNLVSQSIPTKLTGVYPVGKTSRFILDSRQMEYHTEDSGDVRILKTDIYYPGKASSSHPAEYIDSRILEIYRSNFIPDSVDLDFLLHHTSLANLNDQPTDQKPLPVIIFSHGANTPAEFYSYLLEELASHGYYVFAMSHTYDVPVIFPDGTFYRENRKLTNQQFTEEVLNQWSNFLDTLKGSMPKAEKIKLIQDHFKNFPGTLNTRRRAHDMYALVKQLYYWNSNPGHWLYQKLDTARIGGLGHSFGGAIIGQCAVDYSFLKSAVNLDGWQFGDMIYQPLKIPFMLIRAGTPKKTDEINDLIFSPAKSDITMAWVDEIGHNNFSDLPLLLGAKGVESIGRLDPQLSASLINRLIANYFKSTLKEDGTQMADPIESPLIHLEVR